MPVTSTHGIDPRACLSEFIAMLLFVFISCGSATGVAGTPGWVQQVSLTFGLCITVLAYTIGHRSGGQINCAVTIGLMVAGELELDQGVCNILAQTLGSIVGAALLGYVKPEDADLTGGLGANVLAPGADGTDIASALVGEIICTFFLVYVVLETAVSPLSANNRRLAPLAIGFAVYLAHSIMIPIDGCSINPTRSFGPALITAMRSESGAVWKHHWIFWVGPIVGSLLAVVWYKIMSLHDHPIMQDIRAEDKAAKKKAAATSAP